MAFKGLQDFINCLDREHELIRIKQFINPELEMAEIVDRISKQSDGGKAILFENTGTNYPVLMNAFGSNKRMCLLFGVNTLDDLGKNIETLFKKFTPSSPSLFQKISLLNEINKISSWMPKLLKVKGECQEVIEKEVDLFSIPIIKCWPDDGGRFITLPMVITKDPKNGMRNVGMYRMQIFKKNLTGMHWHRHKVGARHFNEYKKRGENMPIAVAIGGDLINTYAATAPIPDNFDEFILSGFLRKKKVDLVKCITQDIEVPADADFIIEGYIDPSEDFLFEGPFGDHTGFYSLPDYFPAFHVTCITHKKNAIYPATIVGIPPQEDALIAKATERLFVKPIKMSFLPEIVDMDIPQVGVAHNLIIIKINKTYPGQAQKVMNSLWGAGQMMFNKVMIIVDNDVDIHNYNELVKYIFKDFNSEKDITFSFGPLDELDHASDKSVYGGKIGIDATKKYIEENRFVKEKSIELKDLYKKGVILDVPEIVAVNYDLLINNIPILLVSIELNNKSPFEIANEVVQNSNFKHIKIIVFVDQEEILNDLYSLIWLVLGNIDAKRDILLLNISNQTPTMVIDGTAKRLQKKKAQRDWPNIITQSMDVIEKIDAVWIELDIGNFIESPSLKYKSLIYNKGVVARK